MPRLVIKARKFQNTPEAWEVFQSRGWQPLNDQSTIPEKRKQVDKGKHTTPLIDVEWEEIEYG